MSTVFVLPQYKVSVHVRENRVLWFSAYSAFNSNVVTWSGRQVHYGPLHLLLRDLLALLDLSVVLAHVRRLILRGDDGGAKLFRIVWICCRSRGHGTRCHQHCPFQPVLRVRSCAMFLVGQLAWPAA